MPDWTGAPYARVYVTLQDDHPAVWADDTLLAWYVRLLVVAQATHPAPAPRPWAIPESTWSDLAAAGVIDAQADRYTIHGLARLRASDRSRRSLGGQIRAQEGPRDALGRYLPVGGPDGGPDGGGPDGGRGSVDGGPDGGPAEVGAMVEVAVEDPPYGPAVRALVDDGGGMVDASTSPANRIESTTSPPGPLSTFGALGDDSPEGSAGAGADGEWPGFVRTAQGYVRVDCHDPDLHQGGWVTVAGVGTKCPPCEAAAVPGTFRERARDHGAAV